MNKQWVAAAIVAATISVGAPAAAQTVGAVVVTDGAEAGPPVAPDGMAASFAPPSQDADGYLTPNRGLAAAETAWHLRVALNVAALGCRGTGEAVAAA